MIKKFDSFVNERIDVASNIMTISPEEACEVVNKVVNRGGEVSLLLTTPDETMLDYFLNAIAEELPAAKERFTRIYKVVSK